MLPSSAHDLNFPLAGVSRIGAELRAARLRLGWALPDIAAVLRIRLPFLEALEDGRTGDLPGVTYAVGFTRNYAAILGLDAAEMAQRFRAETHEVNQKTVLTFPGPVPERGVPAGAVALLGAVLMLGAYAGWYHLSGSAPPSAEAIPPVPERLAPLANRIAPPDPAPVPTVALPGPSNSALAAPIAVPSPDAPSPSEPSPSQAAPNQALAEAGSSESRIMLRVKAEAWIQVRERQGQVLLSRIMRAGDTWPVPSGTQLLLSTGNAGGTELLVDGEAIPALGGSGAIRRDVPLDPDALKGVSTARPAAQ